MACEIARKYLNDSKIGDSGSFWNFHKTLEQNRPNGHLTHRLPNTLHVSFAGKVEKKFIPMDGGASTGAASIPIRNYRHLKDCSNEVGSFIRFSVGGQLQETWKELLSLLKIPSSVQTEGSVVWAIY
jgi:hypothetical protein